MNALRRTRVKICGLRTPDDARVAAEAGADAVGLVFFPPSPRHLEIAAAREIAAALPPFVARVALFVNPEEAMVRAVLEQVRIELIQFHGDEPPEFCGSFGLPYLKAARVRPGFDLLNYLSSHRDAAGWLLDSFKADKWGGTGATFDWSEIPVGAERPLILSGGLDPENVGDAIRAVGPWAVDVSSGVERSKGVKDHDRIRRFLAAVHEADQCR